MEEGVAVAGVAGARDFEKAGEDFFVLAGDAAGGAIFRPVWRAEFGVAGDQPRVDESYCELDVFGVEAFALGEGAGHGRDAQAGSPTEPG